MIGNLKVESDSYRRRFSAKILSDLALLLRSGEDSTDQSCFESRWLHQAYKKEEEEEVKALELKFSSALDKLLGNLCNFIGASNSENAPYRHAGAQLALSDVLTSSQHQRSLSLIDCYYPEHPTQPQLQKQKPRRVSSLSSRPEQNDRCIWSCFKIHPIVRSRCVDFIIKPDPLSSDVDSLSCALHVMVTLVPHLPLVDITELHPLIPIISTYSNICLSILSPSIFFYKKIFLFMSLILIFCPSCFF